MLASVPGSAGPAHTVIVPAFVANEARLYSIDLMFTPDPQTVLVSLHTLGISALFSGQAEDTETRDCRKRRPLPLETHALETQPVEVAEGL
jgi:hypothetical protein